jgi:ABC-type uncharacterized transport system permease subunit
MHSKKELYYRKNNRDTCTQEEREIFGKDIHLSLYSIFMIIYTIGIWFERLYLLQLILHYVKILCNCKEYSYPLLWIKINIFIID